MSPTTIPVISSRHHQTFKVLQQSMIGKSLILCLDRDKAAVKNAQLAYNSLLIHFPQWSSRSALVFFVAPTDSSCPKNVYFYPEIDKEARGAFMASATVKIALDASHELDNNNSVPTLISTHVQHINQVKVDPSDHANIAKALNNMLCTQPLNRADLANLYKSTHKRLFLFDYDGTLTPIVSNPADAQPTPILLNYLNELCRDPANTVWIISGRDQFFLDTYLGKIPRLGLSAEHGSFMKKAGFNDWIDMLKDADMAWKNIALKIFEKYTIRNPGTVIEQKKSSITWHYRNAADTEEATRQSELGHQELLEIPGVDILVGKMNLEVRSLLVNKGEVVKRIKQKQQSDFIMCAGDDQTDEDMFNALKEDQKAFCVSVGPLNKSTQAKYYVEHSEDVVNIIGQLVSTNNSTL